MKIFEVISEYSKGDSDEIITERKYVTSEDDSIKTVTEYFAQHCFEHEKDLKSVREAPARDGAIFLILAGPPFNDSITVVQHIKRDQNKEVG